MHSMVALKSLVSDGNHILSLFVCRSWQTFQSFPSLKERYRSVLYAAESQDFQVCSRSSEECLLSQTLSSARPDFFSFASRTVFSVRLTARCPRGWWACSALSLKASCRRFLLIISMESSFRDFRILLWVPKDGGRPINVMRTTSSSGSFRLASLSLLQMDSIDLT